MTNSNNSYDSSLKNTAVGTAAFVAGWEGQTYLYKVARYPVKKYINREIKTIQGGGFLPYVNTALKQNKLNDDLKIINLNESNATKVAEELKIKTPKNVKVSKFIFHILRLPSNKDFFDRTTKGQNAFFHPRENAVVCNFDKFGSPVFHEIQHKLNEKSSNILVKSLVKLKHPLAIFGTLAVSTCALLTDKKKAGEKEGVSDKVKNNCGLLAFVCMLPHTIEEFIANIKGTEIAKKAGLTEEMLKKVKTAHKISMISYGTTTVLFALSVWGGNKIRDIICEQKS